MKFIALKTENGRITGKISFYCKALEVSRQGFYEYLKNKDKPWKYETLAAIMIKIREEDEYNGRVRMREALLLKKEEENLKAEIPEERTVYRIMERLGISHRPRGLFPQKVSAPQVQVLNRLLQEITAIPYTPTTP